MVVEGQDGGVLYVRSAGGTLQRVPLRTSPSIVVIFGLLQGFFGVPDGEAVSVCVSVSGGGSGIGMSRLLSGGRGRRSVGEGSTAAKLINGLLSNLVCGGLFMRQLCGPR